MSFPPPSSPPPSPFRTGNDHLAQAPAGAHRPSGPPAALYVPTPSAAPRTRWGLRFGLVFVFLGAVAGSTFAAKARFLPRADVAPGLLIDGDAVPAGSDLAKLRAFVESKAAERTQRKIVLVAPRPPAAAAVLAGTAVAAPGTPLEGKPLVESTLGALGLTVDVEATMALASRVGKEGDLWGRIETLRAAKAGRIDVPLQMHFAREATFSLLEPHKVAFDTGPVSARLDLDKHATIPEIEGRYLDLDTTVARLEHLAFDRSPAAGTDPVIRLELPMATYAARVSTAYLKNLDISTVMAEYETFFSRGGDQRRRGKNIDNASQKLDGLVISPGETVSFNGVVGARSEANGFQRSWEIFKGEMVEGVGGGTCQVASTFHAVSFFGGFDVLERLPHSRPSAYIPMGLDSTVVYPAVDLKVRNPHPFPVVVHAKTEGGKLRVELLGKMRPVEVSFGRQVVATINFKRKIVEEPRLTGRKVLVKQHGIKGYRIRRSRLMKYPDGTSKKEDATDFYPPTTEIYHVPVGFDVALLPSLAGAEGEDADLGGNPSPAPPSARAPSTPAAASSATACAECDKPAEGVEFVDGPGAHAPTSAQRDPAKSIWLKR